MRIGPRPPRRRAGFSPIAHKCASASFGLLQWRPSTNHTRPRAMIARKGRSNVDPYRQSARIHLVRRGKRSVCPTATSQRYPPRAETRYSKHNTRHQAAEIHCCQQPMRSLINCQACSSNVDGNPGRQPLFYSRKPVSEYIRRGQGVAVFGALQQQLHCG